jgi:hypothetical protein
MTLGTAAPTAGSPTASLRSALVRAELRSLVVPVALFLVALGIRLLAAHAIVMPVTEDGKYYEHIAARTVEGHGVTSLALWSYSTPPLVIPRPAFEIWMPAASLLSIPFMALFGASHASAQLGSVLVGSIVAPAAWWLGRDAARSLGLTGDRVRAIAVGSGVLAAVLGPFVAAAADPDSTNVFLVTGVLAAILMQRTITAPTFARGALLGIALGLAYLARQEAVWLAATYLIMLALAARDWSGDRTRALARRLVPVLAGGLVLALPWLIRQWMAFGTPFPGQALENALHIRGEDIFAYLDRPNLERFLAQGIDTILGQRVTAIGYQLQGILVVAFPVGIVGTIGAVVLARTPALRPSSALFALFVSGWLIFLATALVFPVATLWGTYRHSAGPLLVGCVVSSVLVGDLAVHRLAAARRWRHASVWLAPMLLVALASPAAMSWVTLHVSKADTLRAELAAVSTALGLTRPVDPALTDGTPTATADVMSDMPILVAATTGLRALGLPDESPEAVVSLAHRFGVDTLVVMGERGRYPGALLTTPRHPCLTADPVRIDGRETPMWLFRLAPACAVR